jgi:hypothetical protein
MMMLRGLGVGVELRKGGGESKAVKVEGMRHVWSLQEGELFSKCVKKLGLRTGKLLMSLSFCDYVAAFPIIGCYLCAATKISDL